MAKWCETKLDRDEIMQKIIKIKRELQLSKRKQVKLMQTEYMGEGGGGEQQKLHYQQISQFNIGV